MPVETQTQQLLDLLASLGSPKTSAGSAEAARAGYAMLLAQPAPGGADESIASVDDRSVDGPAGPIPIRVYRARSVSASPTVVFFHGGGWVIGSVQTHDQQARLLCKAIGGVVVSVDYRLAPENPFPAALDDCWAVTCWAAEHIDELGDQADRFAVAGDSAGGNLAAVIALRARDQGLGLAAQLLIYPVTDAARSSRSYRENAEGYLLDADTMNWFWDQYLDGHEATPDSSVIDAKDHSGVAPAIVVTAEYDPLRDEGTAYAAALKAAGVPVTLVENPGLIHGFFGLTTHIEAAAQAAARFLSEFRQLLERA